MEKHPVTFLSPRGYNFLFVFLKIKSIAPKMIVIFYNILSQEPTKLKNKQDLRAITMLALMKPDLNNAGGVAASLASGRPGIQSSSVEN